MAVQTKRAKKYEALCRHHCACTNANRMVTKAAFSIFIMHISVYEFLFSLLLNLVVFMRFILLRALCASFSHHIFLHVLL